MNSMKSPPFGMVQPNEHRSFQGESVLLKYINCFQVMDPTFFNLMFVFSPKSPKVMKIEHIFFAISLQHYFFPHGI